MNGPPRALDIVPPRARREGQLVLRASALVMMSGLLVIARAGRQPDAASALAPYQLRYSDLAPAEQRIARELREGLIEAEATRARSHGWPTPEQLADDGVPPFAQDPLAPRLKWSLLRDGYTVNYLGESGPGEPAYLLFIQEPEPGMGDPPGTPPDDIHHRLADGTILHVYSCIRESAPTTAGATSKPWLEGWKQLVVANPKEAM